MLVVRRGNRHKQRLLPTLQERQGGVLHPQPGGARDQGLSQQGPFADGADRLVLTPLAETTWLGGDMKYALVGLAILASLVLANQVQAYDPDNLEGFLFPEERAVFYAGFQ